MNLARKALLILPILFVFAMPLAASADSAAVGSANWHIIPDACKCENSAPDFGCVLQVTQNVMNLGVYLALILMTIAIATAGFLWIFAPISAQNREMAKSTLTNAVIGIVIVLSAWLVVDFVMKKLYGQDNAWGPWNEILHANGGECIRTIGSTGTTPSTNNNNQGGVQTTPNPPTQSGPTNANEQAVRDQLASAGVSINKAACPASAGNSCGGTPPSCTNVGGMQSGTIQQIINIKHACGSGCTVEVTGGTEPGHACGSLSHGNGYKVDLHPTSALDSFLEGSSMTSIGTRTGDHAGPAWTDHCGQNQYVRESGSQAHWDITVHGACSF